MIIITKDMETLKSNLYKHNIALLELKNISEALEKKNLTGSYGDIAISI